jgi:phage terminase large subunit-like protein
MGLHGRGSSFLLRARREAETRKRAPDPWKKRGLSRLEKVVRFIEFCPVTKGIRLGEKLKLLPDQVDFLRAIYDRPADQPVRLAVKSAPRGNGKTGLLAPLTLCHLLGPEAEPRGEVYSAAIDRQQAGIMYAEMEAIILHPSTGFAGRVNTLRVHKRIEVLDGDGKGSRYEALSSDARRAHGLSPTLWVYDELAQAKDAELLDNLQTAMGKRDRSLGVIISTQAPSDEHALSQIIDDGLSGADPSIVVHLLAAPDDADVFDPEVLRSVNPAIGKFLNEADLLFDLERAKRNGAFEGKYRNLRLNQRVDADQDARLCHAAEWKKSGLPVDRAGLRGRRCWGALDLSGKHDLTSFTLVFPDDADPPGFDVLQWFWTPADQIDGPERRAGESEKLREWIRAGFIAAIPGPIIRYDFVATTVAELAREFDIQAIAYDRYKIQDFLADLLKADAEFPAPLHEFGQGYVSIAPAVDWFDEVTRTGRLRHGSNPVLTSCVVNAVLVSDPAGNRKIHKGRSRGRGPVRIDGAVTLVMALMLAKKAPPKFDVLAMVA